MHLYIIHLFCDIVFYNEFLMNTGDKTGLPRPPAFLDPSLTEDVILENGVNFASGGGGILNETGGLFVSCKTKIFKLKLYTLAGDV